MKVRARSGGEVGQQQEMVKKTRKVKGRFLFFLMVSLLPWTDKRFEVRDHTFTFKELQ